MFGLSAFRTGGSFSSATRSQFDWAHKFYHTNNWFAVAARHFFDELTLGQDAIEFSIATNFVLETAFTNLQFVGLASLARESSDHMFERMVTSIRSLTGHLGSLDNTNSSKASTWFCRPKQALRPLSHRRNGQQPGQLKFRSPRRSEDFDFVDTFPFAKPK
jgi:hypothetical protein